MTIAANLSRNYVSRPVVLRLLPPRLRQSLWSRLYRPTPSRYLGLFDSAPLQYAPQFSMTLRPGDVISDSIAFMGFYGLERSRLITRIAAKEPGLMVEVGANIGYFSLLWCGQHERNRVIAFEPSPEISGMLARNIQSNHLYDRICKRQEAVADRPGSLSFDDGGDVQTGWGGFSRDTTARSITVDVITLDEALADVEQISMLKVDAQGADTWALRGAERILRKLRPRHVMWEQHHIRMQQLGISYREAEEFMRSMDYDPNPLGGPAGEVVKWYARRK